MRPPLLPLALSTKKDFFPIWHAGRLGTKLRSWPRLQDVPKDLPVPVMFRDKRIGGGLCLVVPRDKAEAVEKSLLLRTPPPILEFNECAPDDRAVLQGEVCETPEGLYALLDIRPPEDQGKMLRMRDVLPRAKEYKGLAALHLLRRFLSPASCGDLFELLELFPSHVVELTVYNRHLGAWPGRNTIIWEVRLY